MEALRRVGVVIYPGFDELDAFGPYEVLRMGADEAGFDVHVAALDAGNEVTASNGAIVRPSVPLQDGEWDLVVAPGGGWVRRQGAYVEAERGELPRALAALHSDGTKIASVCTGAMLLAAAGLTEGRPAITHPAAIDALRATGAEIVEARVVDDGDVLTAGGITAGLDLGLWLLERFHGRELADTIAGRIEYPRVGDIHLGPRSNGDRVEAGASPPSVA